MSWPAFVAALQRVPGAGSFWWQLMDGRDMTGAQLIMAGLVISIGFVMVRLYDRHRPGWWLVAALLQSLAIFLQFKRGVWMCTAFAVVLFVGVKARWSRRLFGRPVVCLVRRWKVVLPLVLLLAAVGLSLPATRRELSHRWSAIHEQASTADPGRRLTMWVVVAPGLLQQYPGGVGYCVLSYEIMRTVYPKIENRKTLHSNTLQVAVELGWVGLVLYLCWMAVALWDALRFAVWSTGRHLRTEMGSMSVLIVLLALMLNGLVECNLRKAPIVLLYGVMMGVAAAGVRRLRQHASGKKRGQSAIPD